MPGSPNHVPARPATTTSSATTESAAATRRTEGTPLHLQQQLVLAHAATSDHRRGSHPRTGGDISATWSGKVVTAPMVTLTRACGRTHGAGPSRALNRPSPGESHGDHLIVAEELTVDDESGSFLVGEQVDHLGADHHLHPPLVLAGEVPHRGLHPSAAGHAGQEVGVTEERGNPGLGGAQVNIGRAGRPEPPGPTSSPPRCRSSPALPPGRG